MRELLREAMAGFDRADFARKIGAEPSLVSKWLAGKCLPSIIHLVTMSRMAGDSIAWLNAVIALYPPILQHRYSWVLEDMFRIFSQQQQQTGGQIKIKTYPMPPRLPLFQ